SYSTTDFTTCLTNLTTTPETIECASLGLNNGDPAQTVDITLGIDSDFTGGTYPATLSNESDIILPLTDPDTSGNNESPLDVDVADQADLQVTTAADSSTAVAGEQASYTMSVDNLGPSDNYGYVVSMDV